MSAPEDLRAVAEGLAGPFNDPCAVRSDHHGGPHCNCIRVNRVSAILARLQEDEEKALDRDRELETVREEYRRFTTLAEDDSWIFDVPPKDKACVAEFRIRWLRERGMLEAAEAKVKELEDAGSIVIRESDALRAKVASLEKERDAAQAEVAACHRQLGDYVEAVALAEDKTDAARAEGKREGYAEGWKDCAKDRDQK